MVQVLRSVAMPDGEGLGMCDVGTLGQQAHQRKRSEPNIIMTKLIGDGDVAVQNRGKDKLTHPVDSTKHREVVLVHKLPARAVRE